MRVYSIVDTVELCRCVAEPEVDANAVADRSAFSRYLCNLFESSQIWREQLKEFER